MALSNLDIARGAFAITPSDTVNLPFQANGIYVGTAGTGTLSVVCQDGSTVNFVSVTAGFIIPLAVIRVNATNTNASNLIGLK